MSRSNYRDQLEAELQAKKEQLQQSRDRIQHLKSNPMKMKDWMDEVTLMNSLSVDVATIKSRIDNLHLKTYLPDQIVINNPNK